MKDEISELDIRKALIDQLKENGSTTKTKKSRKNKRPKEESLNAKKRKKSSKEKDDNKTVTLPSKTVQQDLQKPLRPPPKVVVFEEPGRSKDKADKPKVNKIPNNRKGNDDDDYDEDDDFLEIARDVKEFGMTGFSKKERRKYEQQKAQALGAKAPKGMKMPYNIYMSHMRVQKLKQDKRQQLERAMGMSTKKKKKETQEKNERSSSSSSTSGWWTDKSSKNLDMSIGKYKKGVQTLSKDDIKRIKSKKR